VFAGEELGTGSSRDWAAKGTDLLGVRATIAESYERIFRDNLVGMGVLPLQFDEGDSWESLELDGSERVAIQGLDDGLDVNNDPPPSQNVPMVRPSNSRSRHRLGRLQPFDTSKMAVSSIWCSVDYSARSSHLRRVAFSGTAKNAGGETSELAAVCRR